MTSYAERQALNEDTFRRANEQLAQKTAQIVEGDTDALVPFLCECPTERCTDVVLLSLAEYERVRSDGRRGLAVRGHENLEIERIVESNDRFLLTEKFGEAGETFAARDPRGG